MPLLFGICSFVLILLAIWKYNVKQYAMTIFNVVWGCLFFICVSDVSKAISMQTFGIIILMITCVNFAYSCGNIRLFGKKNNNVTYRCNYNLLKILLLLSLIIMLYYCIATLIKNGFDLLVIREMNNSDSETKVFESLIDTIIFYGFAVPMVYLGGLSVAYNVSQKDKIPKGIIALLVSNIVIYVITVGGRTLIMRIIMFTIAAFLWRIHESGTKKLKMQKIIFYAVIIYLAMNLITNLRNYYAISFIEQAIMYFKGAILHMDYNISYTVREANYYGYLVYGGFLYYPVKAIKTIFDIELLTSSDIMSYLQTYKFFKLNNQSLYYNALIPNAYFYYFDSGYMGVIAFSSFLGLAARKMEMAYKSPTFGKFILWGTAVFGLVYSILGCVLTNFTYPSAIIYCVLLQKFLYKKVVQYE